MGYKDNSGDVVMSDIMIQCSVQRSILIEDMEDVIKENLTYI